MYVKGFLLVLFFICQMAAIGQNRVLLSIESQKIRGIERNEKYVDSLKVEKYIQNIIQEWKKENYLLANIDTIFCKNDSCFSVLYQGAKYDWGQVRVDSMSQLALEMADPRYDKWIKNSIRPHGIESLTHEFIQFSLENGFPFAAINFQADSIQGNNISGELSASTGPHVVFDTLVNSGPCEINRYFLRRYLDIIPNKTYDQRKILAIKSKLQNLQYLKLEGDPNVQFTHNKAKLDLRLVKQSANRFDFLIGVLPQDNVDGSRKWIISGDVTLEFQNRFGQGEYLYFQFKRLKPDNQEIIIRSDVPYLFKTPFGASLDFRLFRNGSNTIETNFDGGFQYFFNGFNSLQATVTSRSSRLIVVDTSAIRANGRLPENLDVVTSGGSLGFLYRNVDYRYNPSKGNTGDLKVFLGRKSILPNLTIVALPGFSDSYDSLSQSNLQLEATLGLAHYFPISNIGTIKLAFSGGYKYNKAGILNNEKFRIGGNRLLRGFDEESIFTDVYGIFTIESRLIFDKNSYLSLPFIDYGFTQVVSEGKLIYDLPIGVGLGINFATSAGIFNVSFAAGKRLGNPFDFGRLKIHFGYVSLF